MAPTPNLRASLGNLKRLRPASQLPPGSLAAASETTELDPAAATTDRRQPRRWLSWWHRHQDTKRLEGQFESYPHLLALKPKEKYLFRSDYFQVDGSVGCVLAFFHDLAAHDGFGPFWGIGRIPDGLDERVTAVVLEQVARRTDKWVDQYTKQSEKLDSLEAGEQADGGTTSSKLRAKKVAGDLEVTISEIQDGASYLSVHNRLLLKAPDLAALEDSIERISRLYIDRFGTLKAAAYAGEQRQELAGLLKRNDKKRGRGFHFTSTEFAGSYSLVTNGLNDAAGEYVGYMVGDVNNSAVLFDSNGYDHHVVVADNAISDYLSRAQISDMWCSKLSQSCLLNNGQVVHLVLDGADLNRLGPRFDTLTSRVDLNTGDVNMFEMFGEEADELAVFAAQMQKLTLMFEQLYEATDGGVGSIIRNELEKTATQFYIDQRMWARNAKTQRHRLRVVGIPHEQVPRLQMFTAYLDTEHKALLNSSKNDPDQLRAYNVLKGVAKNLLDNNGDLFNNHTAAAVDGIREAKRVVYDFSRLMRRGRGVAMAQLVNIVGFAIGKLERGDTVIIHGAETIDDRVKAYVELQFEQLYQRGGRVVFSYNDVDKMLADVKFNKFDAADYTIFGAMRDKTVADYQQLLHQRIPPDLAQLITRKGENLSYLRRGVSNVVFHLDLALGINPNREKQRRELHRAARRTEATLKFDAVMTTKPVPGANVTSVGGASSDTEPHAAEPGRSQPSTDVEEDPRRRPPGGNAARRSRTEDAEGDEEATRQEHRMTPLSNAAQAITRTRVRALAAAGAQPTWVRTVAGGLLGTLVLVLLLVALAPVAHADDPRDEDQKDYSLYHLTSNASVYFSEKSAPENDGKGTGDSWKTVVSNPAQAGSMLGYADDDGFVKWLFSTISGSSQTIKYDAFDSAHASGMKDYSHFGAATRDLGFDDMISSAGFDPMIHAVGGSLIWTVYALAMGVSILFWIFVQILKLLNPFLWFHNGIAAVSPSYKVWADGMVTTSSGTNTTPEALSGLSGFVSQWYGTLVALSWGVLVPLFIGFLLLGLAFFKKMDRGSTIKKLVVRLVFIGVGLPLIGGMYTSILDQFDDSLLSQSVGPTKVVLSTYVDFNAWMNTNRLHIPANASITWDAETGHAQPVSVFSARNSALAINAQTGKYPGITAGDKISDAGSAWANNNPGLKNSETDKNAVFATLGMLGRYIQGQKVNASDFESNVQGAVTAIPSDDVNWDLKKNWFLGKSYKDSKDFGEGGNPVPPSEHPLVATSSTGLTATTNGAGTEFSSTSGNPRCGFTVVEPNTDGKPADCNLAPLAAYNYLNTEFNSDSMTIFSSNKVTSGFTRSFHSSVAQIGTGPASFMYWANAFTLLSSITMIGLFYGIGMLTGALRRTFGTVAAIPFATMGAMAGIAKVIIYSVAMMLEVLVTLFLYQFVSEFLVSLPQIIEGPIAKLVSSNPTGTDRGITNIFGNPVLGSIAVVVMTVVSIVLIISVTLTLLRVRKSALKALDEAVTKLVDKFLDTTTPPKQSSNGLLPALAGGLGAGAGMAAGQGLMGKLGGKPPKARVNKPSNTGQPTSPSVSANAGGTNGNMALTSAKAAELTGRTPGELGSGSPGSETPPSDPPNGPGGPRGTGGAGPRGPGSLREPTGEPGTGDSVGTGTAEEAAGSNGIDTRSNSKCGRSKPTVADTGSPIASSKRKNRAESSPPQDDRELAERVSNQGGLSDLGTDKQHRSPRRTPGQTDPSARKKPGSAKGPAGHGGTSNNPKIGDQPRPNRASTPPSSPQRGHGPSRRATPRGSANNGAPKAPDRADPHRTEAPTGPLNRRNPPQPVTKPSPRARIWEVPPAPEPPRPRKPARPMPSTPEPRDQRSTSAEPPKE